MFNYQLCIKLCFEIASYCEFQHLNNSAVTRIKVLLIVSLTISCHQFQFLIGKYSVAEISYFIKKEVKMIKTQFFDEKQQKMSKKVYVNMM